MNIWKPKLNANYQATNAGTVIVDNRVFVIGLDNLYRESMKDFESKTLLPCARTIAKKLRVRPVDIPIEGYYNESENLKEYFRLMRSLQNVDESKEKEVQNRIEFSLLLDVTSSELFGRPQREGKLFPVGRDPLAQALKDTAPEWNVANLVEAAYDAALRYNDFSLVGLAARTRDAVALTVTRESVVLYAEVVTLGVFREPEYTYKWQVDQELADAANCFIDTFNRYVPNALPKAEAANAERFHKSFLDNEIVGRCVRIGKTPDGEQNYHWAIMRKSVGPEAFELVVDAFWDKNLWTTEKYRAFQGNTRGMKSFQEDGVPEDIWGFHG